MGDIKGCGIESCVARKKKITYKESEVFCSRCGSSLVHVCKDCYTQLPDNSEKYCVRCLAKHQDRKDKAKKVAVGVGGSALAVGGVILTVGKKVFDVAKKLKG
jgi:hypothetical protein